MISEMSTRRNKNTGTTSKRQRTADENERQQLVEEVEDPRTNSMRSIARIKFNRAVDFAHSSTEVGNVTVYIDLLEEAWKLFTVEEVEELLDAYLEVKSILFDRLGQKKTETTSFLALQFSELQGYEKLPKFSGDYQEWISFRDAFMLEVGGSKLLEPKNKLRRLLGCLEGRAKRIVGNWEYADENYQRAWQTLVDEFENQDLAINGHLDELFNLKKCEMADTDSLKELTDIAKGKQRDILSMKNMTEEKLGDILWRKEIERRLDEASLSAWLMSKKAEEIATCEELYDFLSKRARSLEVSRPGSSMDQLQRYQDQEDKEQSMDTCKSGNSRGNLPQYLRRECLYCGIKNQSLLRFRQFKCERS